MSGFYRNLKSLVSLYGRPLSNNRAGLPTNSAHIEKSSVIIGKTASHYFSSISNPRVHSDDRIGFVKIIPIAHINSQQRRFKKKKAQSSKNDDEEEESDDEDLSNENPLLVDDILGETTDGSENMTININSLRLDAFCKTAFAMTRAKVEECFYKGDIYVNGEQPYKKSMDISIKDEIDIIKGINADDSKMVNIKRALVMSMPDKATQSGRMNLDIKRWNNLVIESPARRNNKEQD